MRLNFVRFSSIDITSVIHFLGGKFSTNFQQESRGGLML